MDSYYSEEIIHYFHDETGSHMQESWQNAQNLRAQHFRNNSMDEENFATKSKQQESERITEIAKTDEKTSSRLERRREQNRKAAAKLRLKKQQKYERLIKNAQNEEDIFVQLQTEVDQLTKIFSENAQILRAHQKQCPFLKISDNSKIYYALK